MDTFTVMVAIVLIMMFMQFEQNWLIWGTVIVVILSTRSLGTAAILILASVAIYLTRDMAQGYWPLLVFGLIILGLLFGMKPQQQQPDYYAPDLGGMMEGL